MVPDTASKPVDSSSLPPTWGVIVVHGVGITKPGDTVHHFLATLNAMDRKHPGTGLDVLSVEEPPEVSLLPCVPPNPPVPAAADHLPVDSESEDRFPVHVRHVTVHSPGADQPQKALFVEVFWADLSDANKGFWDWGGLSQIVLRMLTLLFQFRYLADMATTHYRLWSAYCHRWFIYLVSLLLCCPIAGPNVFLFYLLAAHFLLGKGQSLVERVRPHLPTWLLSPLAFAIGGAVLATLGGVLWIISWRKRWLVKPRVLCAAVLGLGVGVGLANLALHLLHEQGAATDWNVSRAEMFGIGAAGTILSLFCLRLLRGYEKDRIWYMVLFGFMCSGMATMIMILLPDSATREELEATASGKRLDHLYTNLVQTGNVFNILMAVFLSTVVSMFFVLGCLVIGLGYPTWLWAMAAIRPERHPQAREAITAAFTTTMLQIGFWVLLMPLFGMAALLYMDPAASSNPLFSRVWTRFAFNLCIAGLPIILGLVVYFRRYLLAKPFFESSTRKDPPRIPRLIAHPALICGLFIASFVGHSSFMYATWMDSDWLNEQWKGYQWWFVGSGLAVLGLAFLVGRQGLLIGLHILRDVVGHFYRTGILLGDTIKRVRNPDDMPTEKFAELFPVEEEIEHRFRFVLAEMLRRLPVTHLIVVAHSQGTIVAIHGLNSPITFEMLEKNNVREVRLVTMGSPFTHLYRHYFPYRYQALKTEDGKINPRHWVELRRVIHHWLNLYRIDDFVGTTIEGPESFPKNQWVFGHAHIGYWTDPKALGALRAWLPGGDGGDHPWQPCSSEEPRQVIKS